MPPTRVLVAVLSLLLSGCVGSAAGQQACDERLPGVRPGLCPIAESDRQPAPVDRMPVLGGDGDEMSLGDLGGQVVVVNFWASWCGPCRTEQPDLNEAARTLPDDEVAFLGVNISDAEANALAHEREFEIPYPSLHDPNNAYTARFGGIGPRTVPSTVIVDDQGRVAARIIGVTTGTEVTVLVDRILAAG